MKTYSKQPKIKSDTAQPKASKQASTHDVLQAYKSKIVQRQEMDEDELLQGKFGDAIQREEFDEDELLQGKFETAQREEIDEDELLQGKFNASSTTQREEATQPLTENKTGMPDNLKSGIESLSGYSMDDVRVHYNSSKPAQLQALAYAQDTDIHVAPGQEQHLPHEAWHVVQQKQGRVQPTMQLQGVNVNDNEGLEKEADVMGGKAVEMETTSEHINDCGCSLCKGTKSLISNKQKIENFNNKYHTIQKCPKCMDPSCKMGEKCKIEDDLEGLLPFGITGVDPVKYYNQKLGHGGESREWEHPLAKAPMKQVGLSSFYFQSPVIGMPKEVHRSAMSGMGGGVTSTGYSTISQGWADHVAEAIKTGGMVVGIKKGLMDDINAYAMQKKLTEGHKSTFIQAVRAFVEKGIISQGEGDILASEIYSHIEDMLRWG